MLRLLYLIFFCWLLVSCISPQSTKEINVYDASETNENSHEEASPRENSFGSESAYCMSQPTDESICHPLYAPKVPIPDSITAKESKTLDLKEEWTLPLPPKCSPTYNCCWVEGCGCHPVVKEFPFNLIFSHPPKEPSRFIYQINDSDVLDLPYPQDLAKENIEKPFGDDSGRVGRNYHRFRFKLIWNSFYAVGAEFYWHKGKQWTGDNFCVMDKVSIFIDVPKEHRR